MRDGLVSATDLMVSPPNYTWFHGMVREHSLDGQGYARFAPHVTPSHHAPTFHNGGDA